MNRWVLQPVLVVLAFAAFLWPALRLETQAGPRIWTAAGLAGAGGDLLAGSPDAYAGAAADLNLAPAILRARPAAELRVSGVFRLAAWLPVELLLAVAFFVVGLALATFRRAGAAALCGGMAFFCALFALLGYVALAAAAHRQEALLRSLGGVAPDAIGVRAGLVVLPVVLLAFSLLPILPPQPPAAPSPIPTAPN